jgi:nocturnin
VGYVGRFLAKPDSPCLYLADNNGPDGCAIFVRRAQFQILAEHRRVLEVWRAPSNQVVLCLRLRERTHSAGGCDLLVATTHLKARGGAHMAAFRKEQGHDLESFFIELLKQEGKAEEGGATCRLLLTGDFNAEPEEPVIRRLTDQQSPLGLTSAYR